MCFLTSAPLLSIPPSDCYSRAPSLTPFKAKPDELNPGQKRKDEEPMPSACPPSVKEE